MANIQASPEAIRDAVQKVNNTKSEIDGKLKQVEGTVLQIASHWKGAAFTQFQNVMIAWNKESKDLSTAIGQIAENMKGNETVYSGTEANIQQDFKGILGQLGVGGGSAG